MAEPKQTARLSALVPVATIGLPVLFVLAIVLLGALMIWQNYKASIAAGEVRAQAAAHVVAAHTEWMIEASDQALRRIDAALDQLDGATLSTTVADIAQAVGDLPRGFQYSVYDAAGDLRFSSIPRASRISVADRGYFQRLRDGDQVVISPMLDERLSAQKVFVIARRLGSPERFEGVASIAVPETRMADFWQTLDLGPGSSVSIIRSDGWLVARFPEVDAALDLSATPLFTRFLPEAPNGFYHGDKSPADSLTRIVGYWRVEGWPLIAVAGIERGAALSSFRANVIGGLSLGIPLLLLLVAGSVLTYRLVTADLRTKAALEEALERNQFLFREIHHRVKNNLQAVASLVRMQPLPAEARTDMARRIAAMVAVHEQIYRSDQFDTVEVAPYAERLVREIAAAYDGAAELDIRMEPLRVGRDQATPIGLILNEVVSNAYKHSFQNGRQGRLSVELATAADGQATLTVSDDGPGFDDATAPKGMGSRLIAGFVAQLGGTYTIESADGTRFSMTFPIERSVV